jgi:hypothetical protein
MVQQAESAVIINRRLESAIADPIADWVPQLYDAVPKAGKLKLRIGPAGARGEGVRLNRCLSHLIGIDG